MSRPPRWSDEQRAEALALREDVGLSEAARRCGIPAGTIASWASRGGHNPSPAANRAATEAAVAKRKRTLEERRAVLVEKLGELAEMGVDWAASALEKGTAELTMRDAVGLFTRAIHDLQLLSGGATSRAVELVDVDDVKRLRDELADRRARRVS